jgi:hypothetical protein
VQAWRVALVQQHKSKGFTAANKFGACRNGAKIDSLNVLLNERGVRSVGVQCEGVLAALNYPRCTHDERKATAEAVSIVVHASRRRTGAIKNILAGSPCATSV